MNSRFVVVLSAAIAGFSGHGRAQQPTAAVPLEKRVDAMFAGASRPGRPGVVVLVAKGDEVLLQKGYGLADLEREVPLRVDSVLDIGSTSKQFTASCVLLLEQQGKLSRADVVRRRIAELPACCDGVTVQHLLQHQSGIPDYIDRMVRAGRRLEDRTTMEDAMETICGVEALQFEPGAEWAYSNSNYVLLAELVERVAGVSLAEFAREHIFEPLGMTSTHVHTDSTALVPRRAFSYSRGRGGWRWNFSNWEQVGDGAVFTTVGDLLLWARNFEHGRVGGDALLAALAERGVAVETGTTYGNGLMHHDLDGAHAVSHGGAWAAYRAELVRVPAHRLVVVCLCNRDDLDPTELARRIARAALGG